jgi:hypothetical protein
MKSIVKANEDIRLYHVKQKLKHQLKLEDIISNEATVI